MLLLTSNSDRLGLYLMLEQGLMVESAYNFWILGALLCLHLHAAFKNVVPVVIILLVECQSQNQQ